MDETVTAIVESMTHRPLHLQNTDVLKPAGARGVQRKTTSLESLASLNDLSEQVTRTYDLSVTAASHIDIPVIGSVGGGYSRRVVVLERAAFQRINEGEVTSQYGYAIRLCLTVSKLETEGKLTLPFLAASAELGRISAQWILQVLGLSGPKIDQATIIPSELNVETFVLAKQSLAALISAVRDDTTRFTPQLIAQERPLSATEKEYGMSVAKAYALAALASGRPLGTAKDRLASTVGYVNDTIADVYREFGQIDDLVSPPSSDARRKAEELLHGVRIRA